MINIDLFINIWQRDGINKLISTSKIKNKIHKAKNFILKDLRILEIVSNPHSKDDREDEVDKDVENNKPINTKTPTIVKERKIVKLIIIFKI